MELGLGVFGFVLMYISDINQVVWRQKALKPLFATGSLFVLITTVMLVVQNLSSIRLEMETIIVFIGFLLSLMLLIYILFYAIPFDDSYVSQFNLREAYTDKIYALTRHPGILPFSAMYGLMMFLFNSEEIIIYSLAMIIMNLLYVYIQDRYIFTKLFTNYNDYKASTPFVIPNFRSFKAMIASYKKGVK